MADGFAGYTASMELNRKELAHMENKQAELMLYGYAPLMISAQCVYKNYASCIREQKKRIWNAVAAVIFERSLSEAV